MTPPPAPDGAQSSKSSTCPASPIPPASRKSRRARHVGLALLVLVLYALHQDVWNWKEYRPLLFGFVPIGLAYHAAFSIAAAGLMALLVRFAWPSHLEANAEPTAPAHGKPATPAANSTPR